MICDFSMLLWNVKPLEMQHNHSRMSVTARPQPVWWKATWLGWWKATTAAAVARRRPEKAGQWERGQCRKEGHLHPTSWTTFCLCSFLQLHLELGTTSLIMLMIRLLIRWFKCLHYCYCMPFGFNSRTKCEKNKMQISSLVVISCRGFNGFDLSKLFVSFMLVFLPNDSSLITCLIWIKLWIKLGFNLVLVQYNILLF